MSNNTYGQLMNCSELDSLYNHTPWFTTKVSQTNWFNQKIIPCGTLSEIMYQRKDGNFKIGKSMYELRNANYLRLTNPDTYETYYYFIIDKLYISDSTTELVLQLDVIQTYMFDFQFLDSLVEREHVYRWKTDGNATQLYVDEPLETGEYVLKNRTELYDYSNKGTYFITSSDRLGVSDDSRPGDKDPKPPDPETGGDNYRRGYLSENGFYFIKSEEGFAPEPYDLGDGTMTTGYGVTSVWQPESYASLLPRCTEEQASKVLGSLNFDNYSNPLLTSLLDDGMTLDQMNQHEFDAFGSLTYNSGLGNVQASDIYNMYITGAPKETIAERWKTTLVTDGEGTVYPGLIARREKESKMFLGETITMKQISNVTDGGYVTENNGKGYIPSEYQN